MSDRDRRRQDDRPTHKFVKQGGPWINIATLAVFIPVMLWFASDYRTQSNRTLDRVIDAVQTLTTTVATTVSEQGNLKERLKDIEDSVESLQQIVWGRSGTRDQ